MRRFGFALAFMAAATMISGFAQEKAGPYKVLKTAKVGGEGGFDYVYGDVTGRKLYIPRTGNGARVTIFNLDTLEPAGEIANTNARGAAVSVKSNHGFASSKPVAMWDAKTLAPSKPSTWRAVRTASCTILSTTAFTCSAIARRTPR